jgi:hypothetical protein
MGLGDELAQRLFGRQIGQATRALKGFGGGFRGDLQNPGAYPCGAADGPALEYSLDWLHILMHTSRHRYSTGLTR